MTTTVSEKKTARERLLETADRLFYAEGVQTVGIDRILDESGVAKRSLYTNFGSKDALIEAYLQHRHDDTTSRLTEAINLSDNPRDKILAVFDVQARTFAEPDFHGCAFMEASSEAAPGSTIDHAAEQFRRWILTMFVGLAEGIDATKPQTLARQLHALYDGGIIAARMDHDPSVAADTKAAAAILIDASTR